VTTAPAPAWGSPATAPTPSASDPLDRLEAQSIYILREAFHTFPRVAMLWSMGKDSNVLLWLARKAFFGHVPFPLIHVDTGFKLPEMIAFRDRLVREWGLELIVERNEEALRARQTFPDGRATRVACCSRLKKDPLQAIVARRELDAVFAGIRRDEEGTRAKERYFSPRGADFSWDFKDQPPELWDQFKTDFAPGTHIRVHPLLHWTEENVWQYVAREGVPVVPLYFARGGCRYRSLGCGPCTKPVPSDAQDVPAILRELAETRVAERSTRAQDQESEDAFERLRADGYM